MKAKIFYAKFKMARLLELNDSRHGNAIAGITSWKTIYQILEHLIEHTNLDSPESGFADIGSGTGRVLACVKERCNSLKYVVGVDIDSHSVKQSQLILNQYCGCSEKAPVVVNCSALEAKESLQNITHLFAFQRGQPPRMQEEILKLILGLNRLRWVVLSWSERDSGKGGNGTHLLAGVFKMFDRVKVGQSTPMAFSTEKSGDFYMWKITKKFRKKVKELMSSNH